LLGGEDYGGEGRKMEDTTAWPTSDLVGRTEQSKGYCGRSGDVYAQIVFTSAHPPSLRREHLFSLTLSQADGGQ
jgi:hypothetical protein